VVKLIAQSDGKTRTGTGFIVKIEPDAVYIATASHVVEGDPTPLVEFFTARNRRVKAEIVKLEGADPKGVGLLAVRGRDKIPANLNALPFETDADPEGADEVVIIGFGQGQGDWAVLKAQVVSVDGRDVKIDGRIEEGNSGGPVLKDGKVVGLITSSQRGLGLATPAQFVKFVLRSWGVDVTRVGVSTPAATSGQAPKRERVEPPRGTSPAPADATVRSDEIGQRYDETARAAIDTMSRAAPQPAPPETSTASSPGRTMACASWGRSWTRDTPAPRQSVRSAHQQADWKLRGAGRPDLSFAPAVVIFMATFDTPQGQRPRSRTFTSPPALPHPVRHRRRAGAELRPDRKRYPAQGRVALEEWLRAHLSPQHSPARGRRGTNCRTPSLLHPHLRRTSACPSSRSTSGAPIGATPKVAGGRLRVRLGQGPLTSDRKDRRHHHRGADYARAGEH
jgi:hypothetical protein